MAMNELDKETVIALAKNNMNTTDTANQLGVHRNTVLNRYERIKNRTGFDPRNFYDLHKLVNMAAGKDIVEVVHGRWIHQEEDIRGISDHQYVCSACGHPYWTARIPNLKYCHNCGADMRGDGNEK